MSFKSFDYTYGVGMELKATSVKQVKDELKLNLDSLSKMVKSYGKVLKIDPDADLSKLFDEMRKIKGLVDGINNSDNSFAGFVDKGTLSRIAALESSMEAVGATSKEVEASLSGLKSSVAAITEALKIAGQIKFPATFENLFGNVQDQSADIKKVVAQIDQLSSSIKALQDSKSKFNKSYDLELDDDITLNQIKGWLTEFQALQEKLSDSSKTNVGIKELEADILKLSELGQKLNSAMLTLGEDFNSIGPDLDSQNGIAFNNFLSSIPKQIDNVIRQIEKKKVALNEQLNQLRDIQTKYNTKLSGQTSSGKSLGVQSDYTAQVKVTPKTNDVEWTSKINDTIKNIEPQLSPVKLTPTFSKSKNIEKDLDGNLAQVNHTVNVDLKVDDNIEQFNEKIKNIDTSIKNAKQQLEKNGNFKIKFEYEEGGKFKDVAYQIINKFKKIDANFYVANGKKFLQDVAGIREKAKKELKDVHIDFEVANQDAILSSVSNLKSEIDKKIGNIGVNLTLQNMPQFMAQAAMMRNDIEEYYKNNPIGNISGSSVLENSTKNTVQDVVELSEKAKKAQVEIEKIKSALKSLNNAGFKSPDFLKLGAFDENLKYIKGSKKQIQQLLQEYEALYEKTHASGEQIVTTYGTYEAYQQDLALCEKMENTLNTILQSQIQYSQKRLETAEKTLQKEVEITKAKKEQVVESKKSNSSQKSEQKQSSEVDEALKKQKQLTSQIKQQKKILEDLDKNGSNSSYFAKIGEWDKESAGFKKNTKEIQTLIARYNELKKARTDAGVKQATGEEASLRGKIGAILRDQKKHITEIIAQNQKELESVKKVANAYEQSGDNKAKTAKIDDCTNKFTKHLDELIAKLNKAKETLELLKSNKFDALGTTGLGDINKRLEISGSKQSFEELINVYNKLIAKRDELEKRGVDISHPEYVANAKLYQAIEQQLSDIYQDQLNYCQTRISQLDTEITKEKEVLKLKSQQNEEESEKPVKQSKSNTSRKTSADTGNASSVVKLDSATLNSLAKDATLKTIDGKVGNILSQLGKGLTITGANVSIDANGVQISDKAAGDHVILNNSNVDMNQILDKTGSVEVYSENKGKVVRKTDTYKSTDKVNEVQEISKWVTHGKDDPGSLEHVSTVFKTNIEAYNKLYQGYIKSLSKQLELTGKISSSSGSTSKLQEELKLQEEITNNIEQQLQNHTELFTEQAKQAAIVEASKKANQEIAKSSAGASDSKINKQINDLNKAIDSVQKKYNGMLSSQENFKNIEVPFGDSAVTKIKEYSQLLEQLKIKQREIESNPKLLQNESYAQGIESLLTKINKAEEEFDDLNQSAVEFLKNIKNTSDIKPLDNIFDPNDLTQMHEAMREFANGIGVGEAKLIKFNDVNRTATFEIQDGRGHIQQLTVAYNEATNSLGRYVSKTTDAVSETQKFFDGIKRSFGNVVKYIASFGSVYELFAIIKQGVTYVKEIDSALTELKKVTNETDATYDAFLQSMSKTGSVIGSTVSNLTTMAAEWARLGYNIEESAKLAESTAILLNVSEFDDATEASEALISTMQAFQYTADESQHVVDILNEVGNNYAVSSDGIAVALQDSASALMEGGNNLEEATALVAAANRVVQDPSQVGSALRTISLRLRGTSVEVLEEMGEETDGVVESVSKMQEKIKALTGVDIVDMNGAYKDTYTILKEIGAAWKDMEDMDKAAALELMAGKNRANVLSAILSNMEDLEGAYDTALNAEGSALRENEAYLDSIQGHVDLFNNSVQTMWMNFIDSDAIKFFVNLGTELVNLISKLDLVRVAFAGILTYFSASSKYKFDLASMLGIHDLEKGFTFGKEGLTGWITKQFGKIKDIKIKKDTKNNLVENILGSTDDAKVTVQDFADAIKDNISNYVTLDTSEIDTQIDSIQNKLSLARKELIDAKNADWDYYHSFGSKSPANDRDTRISEKTQEIKALEMQLTSLQSKRDEIVSSAAMEVATSTTTQIQSQTNAYESMLSVLSEVKSMKLSIGNEQDAARKIDEISEAAQNGQMALANYVSTLDDGDIALKAYVASVDDGNYSLAGFQQYIQQHNASVQASGAAAKLAAVGHQLLNAAISMGATVLLSVAISALDKWINKQKEAAEAAENAITTYNNAQNSLREQKSVVDELEQSYAVLSNGVDLSTNANINLATDSYQEYLDTCNKIADMYPHLVTGFDAQGNAILSLKGNVDELIKAYEDAASASRLEMIASGDDVFDTFKSSYTEDTYGWNSQTSLSTQLEIVSRLQEALATGDEDALQEAFDSFDLTHMKNTLEAAGIELNDIRSVWTGNVDLEGFKENSEKLLGYIKSTTTKINAETNGVKTLMDAYLGENTKYVGFDDKTRSVIDQFVSGLSAEFISGFDDADALWTWIETNVVNAFADKDIGKEISESMSGAFDLQTQFKNNEIDLSSYKDQILSFVDTIKNSGLNKEVQEQILQMFDIDFDNAESIGSEIDQMFTYVQGIVNEDTKGKVLELSYSDLQIINSDQFTVPSGTLLSWDELQAKIQETKIAMTEDFTTDDFAGYTDSINSIQSSISTYQEALEKLDSGTFTISDFMSLIGEYPDLAKGVNIASKSFDGLDGNLRRAMRASPKSLINDLKELKYNLQEAGKSTTYIDQLIESIESMPEDAIESVTDEYITLADEINAAKVAQNELNTAMSENPNEGFETRGSAIDQMKTLMEQGAIGSESELWSIAEAFGFTYDSAATINENADALYEFIKAREKWYATDDDGNYTYKGTESFINDVEKASQSDEFKEALKKQGLDSSDFEWSYEDGKLDFDFDNENWDKIVAALGETKELAGLTSEEFYDLLMQVGQFFDVNWENSDDIISYLKAIADGTDEPTEKLQKYAAAMEQAFGKNGKDTDIDLTNRPVVNETTMQEAGWADFEDGYATVYSSSFSNEDGTKTVVVTPILPNGEVLSPEELETYADKLLKGEELEPGIDIKLAEFNGEDSVQQADDYSQALHEAQEQYQELQDPLEIETTIAKDGLEGLNKIADLQGSIKADSDGITVIDTDAFTDALEAAGYTEEQINSLIAKVKEYENVCEITTNDPLGLNNTDASINTVMSSLSYLGVQYEITKGTLEDPAEINITSKDLITTLQEKGWTREQIVSYLSTLTSEENGLGITIDGQVNMNAEQIDDAIELANTIPEEESTAYSVTGDGASILDGIITDWSKVPSTKSTNYSINKTTYERTEHVGGSGGHYSPVNGTAHVQGTAFKGGSWGAPETDEMSLVGELGPEILVRNGRWQTIGQNGAEFTQVKKGDIIFNHKQTEQLLKNGYVTGRGKAYANGTAYASGSSQRNAYTFSDTEDSVYLYDNKYKTASGELSDAADDLSDAADNISDSSEEFRETFDWIEVRLEEINEDISLKNAQLENKVGYKAQNKTIDQMIALNQNLYNNLIAGANRYYSYASKLLSKIPAEYREAAKDGSIAIEEFVGEVDEKTLTAIQEYREWVQKGADATQQAEETLTEISTLARQAIENIAQTYENRNSLRDNQIDQLEAQNSLLETDTGFESANVYKEMIKLNNKNISMLEKQRDAMQAELNKRVESGEIKKYSQDWYDAVNEIAAVDTEIINAKEDTENWQDAINELHWEKFDLLISKLEAVSSEAENLIDVLSNEDMVDESGNWTDEGITTLGLYAQQMEAAEVQAKKYQEEIDYLNKNWKKLGYTEEEYIEKLDELKAGQYDAIQAYHDSKDAIVDLNQERIDAIKEGIEKEIEAYEELIEKKKEELDAEKDLYDFQKSVMEQEKDIADIERQLAALSGDNSASARAKRAQLEAELAEANAALEETYYERSVSNQQEALDKELENFQEEKDEEMEGWDEYLENTEQVVADSLATVQANTEVVYQTLKDMGKEYGLSITESLTSPWKEGEYAIQSFSEQFGIAMSATVEELKQLELDFKNTMLNISLEGVNAVNEVRENAEGYTEAEKSKPKETEDKNKDKGKNNNGDKNKTIKVGGKINAKGAKIYDYVGDKTGEKQYFAKDPIYKVLAIDGNWIKVRHHKAKSGASGWFKKGDVKAYAKGSFGVDEDQLALIDELGEELVMHADGNGRLAFLSKGSAVIPHDISKNIMELGQLDPSIILDRNRPEIGAPHVTNNEISINMNIAEVVHIDEVTNDTIPDLTKTIEKQMDAYMVKLNNAIKAKVR